MTPSDVAASSLTRIAFMFSLDLEGEQQIIEPADADTPWRLKARFRFPNAPNRLLAVTLRAGDANTCPHVDVAVKLPEVPTSVFLLDILQTANTLNRRGACASVSYDSEARRIEVRSQIVFTGYHNDPEQQFDHSFEQREATVNLLAQVFGLAREALDAVMQAPTTSPVAPSGRSSVPSQGR